MSGTETAAEHGGGAGDRASPLTPTPERVAAVLGALCLALFLVWAWHDGGYARTTWLPGAAFVVALAAVALVVGGRGLAAPPYALVALALLAAFTAWNAATMLWAGNAATAWDGTNRTLLYLAVFALFIALPLSPRTAVALVGGFSLAVGALALFAVARATLGDDPARWYISGRLAFPSDYSNADVALFLSAFWPCVHFASRRTVHPVLRGSFLAAAGALVEAAVLCQSRASLVAVPVVAGLFLAFSPGRLRILLSLALVGIAGGLTVTELVDVYPALIDGHASSDLLGRAGEVTIAACVALFVAGTLVGLVDRRVALPGRLTRAVAIALAVLAVGVLIAGTGLTLHRHGDPVHLARVGWERFKTERSDDYQNLHFTSGLGSNRYDLWRVALLQFERSPLQGIGSDNYATPYLAERRTALEEPLYPHSLPLRLLSQTGIVGTLLFTGFLLVVLVGVVRTRARMGALQRATAVAALASTAYWLVHGSVDWLWEIPALGAPAIAFLALALVLADGRPAPVAPRRSIRLAVVCCALVGVASLIPPWIAAKETDLAAQHWPASPKLAFDRLALARRLNPLSDQPDVYAAVIAQRRDDPARERASWQRVVARNPANWYAHLKLALLADRAGSRTAALGEIATARRLNPLEPVLLLVQRKLRAGAPVSAAEVDRLFVARSETLLRASSGQRRDR